MQYTTTTNIWLSYILIFVIDCLSNTTYKLCQQKKTSQKKCCQMENSKVELKKKEKSTTEQDQQLRKFRIWVFLWLEILKGTFVGNKVILSRTDIFRSQILHTLLQDETEKCKKKVKFYLCTPRKHGQITRIASLILNLDTR